MSTEAHEYDAVRIQVLTGIEAVRKRPGTYLGSTGERGLHHLVFDVVGRAAVEASTVEITLTDNGGIRVTDDGPGTAFDELTTERRRPPQRSRPRGLSRRPGSSGAGMGAPS